MADLFDMLDDTPAARSSDPATSHDAARLLTASGERGRQVLLVAAAVAANPGLTSAELAARCGLDRHMVARRTGEAARLGLVRRGEPKACTATTRPGLKAISWWPAEGRA